MACTNRNHRSAWRVEVRNANYSAFNGGHRTPSAYSQLRCWDCGEVWRTKAAYVDDTPNADVCVAGCGYFAQTTCRICRRPYCRTCLTDHHHEGHGTPTTDTR